MADAPRPQLKVDAKASTTVRVDHVDRQTPPPFGTVSVAADPYVSGSLKGLTSWVVALSIKANLDTTLAAIRAAGGIATSSGGIRDLNTKVTSARSATSFHYTGRAIDLYIYSGMVDPLKDPYVVTADPEIGTWRVFARTTDSTVTPSTLIGLKYKYAPPPNGSKVRLSEVEVTDRFFDLTALFLQNGFHRIPAKSEFMKDPLARDYASAEWWHFQDETGLVVGQTTFGSLLQQVHTVAELKDSPPFVSKDKIWNGLTFP
jgi:hypothetical protein